MHLCIKSALASDEPEPIQILQGIDGAEKQVFAGEQSPLEPVFYNVRGSSSSYVSLPLLLQGLEILMQL